MGEVKQLSKEEIENTVYNGRLEKIKTINNLFNL